MVEFSFKLMSIVAAGIISGSNTYKIGEAIKITNYVNETVDARCDSIDEKIVIKITGGSVGLVNIERKIVNNLLYVEQVFPNFYSISY